MMLKSNKIWWYLPQCPCAALEHLACLPWWLWLKRLVEDVLFPETDTRAVPAAFAGVLALNVALPHTDSCTETLVTAQIHLCFLGFAHLFANATRSCSAVPPSCKAIYLFIFNPHQKPRNLYQLTQLLAMVGEAQIQQQHRPNPFSWKVLCRYLLWKHRCDLFSCWGFWCHRFPGKGAWPRV